MNSTGGILYAGDYIREDIEAGGLTIEFLLRAAGTRRLWRLPGRRTP